MIEFENEVEECFVAVDVETTGLSCVANEMIEISAIKYQGRQIVDKFVTFIKPKIAIPYPITRITGITNEMVKNAPGIEEVMPKLIDFIGEAVIVAHNASFDFGFLQNYSNYGFSKNKVVDTVRLSRILHPELPNHKLGTVAKHIGIEEDGFHRAEFDSECCAQIYIKYMNF